MAALGLWPVLQAQEGEKSAGPEGTPPGPDKRVFGVLPNYRTTDGSLPFSPITARQKMTIAAKDSFDWPVYLVSGAFAGLGQLEDQNPSFHQGLKGYGRRYAGAYLDQIGGNFLTEGIMPGLTREDPRYFRMGSGSGRGRAGYALTRVFGARTDTGRWRFNFSEFLGNSAATGLSNAYLPNQRNLPDNLQKLGIQYATDAFSNVLKEFWPDVKRKYQSRHHSGGHKSNRPVSGS